MPPRADGSSETRRPTSLLNWASDSKSRSTSLGVAVTGGVGEGEMLVAAGGSGVRLVADGVAGVSVTVGEGGGEAVSPGGPLG